MKIVGLVQIRQGLIGKLLSEPAAVPGMARLRISVVVMAICNCTIQPFRGWLFLHIVRVLDFLVVVTDLTYYLMLQIHPRDDQFGENGDAWHIHELGCLQGRMEEVLDPILQFDGDQGV